LSWIKLIELGGIGGYAEQECIGVNAWHEYTGGNALA